MDRNRWQLVIVVVLFSLAMSAMLTAVLFVLALGAVLLLGALVAPGLREEALVGVLDRLPFWLALASALGVIVYVGRTLTRSERWFAERLGAKLTATGECIPTKMMLKDMA
ncbi:hypothetical protein EG835_03285, partial [bacterium]|nr:hypothetical protein [bacterium]